VGEGNEVERVVDLRITLAADVVDVGDDIASRPERLLSSRNSAAAACACPNAGSPDSSLT